ncbi:MAG TPA: anti-sigma factor [Mesorhizobium sp.]|jgi:anti-sigma factor RsiW|uniref:anti-sigma factor family protein n=1 Tax=Mesorhizobium sp. TaxID=1871066 RepID=UPI002DDC9138|nr:anti-sigma factor [Mesorhizobium sp.]HEV2507781.1 anti-sigma factor [Mesorhizobium sp.]
MTAHYDGLPEDKAEMTMMVHTLVDGELDAAMALAVERRIAADPELGAEHARITALRIAMGNLPKPQPAQAFLERIQAIGSADTDQAVRTSVLPFRTASAKPRTERSRWGWSARSATFDWRALAASIAITAVVASGATQWAMIGVSDDFAAAVASGHRRSLLAANPVDVVSSDRHTVKPWLDGRLGMSPPAPDLAKEGFALVGGRVEVVDGQPIPALVYRHNEHLITLVAKPRNGGDASNPVDRSADGFSMVSWSDRAFAYWAITDMERSGLDEFVTRFRAAAAI